MNKTTTLKQLLLFTCLIFLTLQSKAVVIASEPNTQATSITASPGSCNEINLVIAPGDGSRRLIIGRADFNVSAFPVDGIGYSASSLFGTGSNLGNGNYVVYNGSGNSTTITGLAGGSEYFFIVLEFNGLGNNSNYLLNNYPEDHAIAEGFTMSISSTSGDMCEDDSVRLEVHGAETYDWSPSGSLSSAHDSIVWATPSQTTQYTVEGSDNSGCSDEKSITITVYQTPNVTLGSFSNKCINAGTVTLNSGSPSGGNYSGNSVSGNHFNPSTAGVGVHVITYTYSDIHGCTDSDTSSIRVLAAPTTTFASLTDVCDKDPAFTLSGGSPTGGVYSGTGVSSGQFDPITAGVGSFQIRYIYTNSSGCADTSYSTQKVRDLPNVTFATLQPVCLNTPAFNLSGGSPTGGDYSGSGVSGSQFSPLVTGAGTFLITYSFTDSHGCSEEDTSQVTVHTLPSVNFAPLSSVCANYGPLTLSGGTPAGGVYSGTAVGGGSFYTGIAGAGSHTITYSYTNSNNCTNSATQSITVHSVPQPDLGSDLLICSDVTAHLNGGSFASYYWSTGENSQSIDVDTSGYGLGTFPFVLIVATSHGCTNRDTILITFDGCSGLNYMSSQNNRLAVFPNPFSSGITILSKEGSDISVYDITGSLIYVKENAPEVFYCGEEFPPGSYFVSARKNQIVEYKLIVKN